jgi:hypothetical protein
MSGGPAINGAPEAAAEAVEAAAQLDGGEAAEAGTAAETPEAAAEPGALPDAAATEAMFEAMSALEPEQTAELRALWGAEAAANLGFAMSAASELESPGLIALLEEGGLGDHPALIEAAAKIGRRLAGEPGAATPPPAAAPPGAERRQGALDQQIDQLTAEIHDAAQRGDLRRVDRLSRRRDDLAERLWGGQPIIGRDQRSL